MNIKSISTTFILIIFFRLLSVAGEGMWIPMLLEQLNEKQMKAMGMKISAEDIYSINHSSMKDAVVLFGRGCTAEIISNKGLLLTNHHCGYSSIQRHSSVEHDYLTDGFWAMSQDEELPNPGLTVTMMKEMREVTNQVLNGVTATMTEKERSQKIEENIKKIVDDFEKNSEYQAVIKPFFQGNQYYMIITETFKDIRLVGAPPSNIGKFGGDTDNWMWPRHTGDFSIFRIYVSPDGKPAEYSKKNVPYTPKYFFPISLKGVENDDFTFVFGYPARTSEYLPAPAIQLIVDKRNPAKIKLRQTRLDIFTKYSDNDPKVRIQYASKHARVSNYWKKMIGESKGIERMHGIERKKDFEKKFTEWVNSSPELKTKYGGLLAVFDSTYHAITPYIMAYDYFREAGMAVELVNFAGNFDNLINESKQKDPDQKKIDDLATQLKNTSALFYKDYYKPIDHDVMAALLDLYNKNISSDFKPEFFTTITEKYHDNYDAYTDVVFEKSIFDDKEKVNELLDNYKTKYYKKIEKDPAFRMYKDLSDLYNGHILQGLESNSRRLDSLQRIYMKAQMEMQPDHRFYPDANFTLRVTYGKVKGYSPEDAVEYRYYTTLEGIIQKEDPEIYDYVVEEKLKELYENKDYGAYAASDGTMRVGFIATNHTTGGNSGSPVLDADGYLVGVNFDRCWEGTMSDLMYDPKVCRNISLDIRYFLFIVDKFAGAGYLVEEMDLVK